MGLLALTVLLSVGSFVFVKHFYDDYFRRLEAPKSTAYLRYGDVPERSPRVVHFESGKNTLAGYVFGEPNDKGLVVISHGLGFGAEDYLAEALYFVDRGWRVFAFDNTGTYASEGSTEIGLPQSALDLDAALTYVESDAALGGLPVMLFGHSWGAYADTAVLKYDHDIVAVVSISGFNSPMGLLNEEMGRMVGPLSHAVYPFGWAYQTALFGKAARLTAVDGINSSDAGVMIVHGAADESVFYDGASIIAQRNNITNPNVVFKTCTAETRNGHNTLLKSEAAIKYAAEMNGVYRRLFDQYNGNVPDDVKAEFHAGLDKLRTSELDPVLFDQINTFFESHINR
jgi:hypothetical protein